MATFTLINDDIKVVYFIFGTIDLNIVIHQVNAQKKDYCCNAANPFKCDQKEELDGFIIQLGLQLLRIGHFADSLHEIFLGDVFTVRADGKQA